MMNVDQTSALALPVVGWYYTFGNTLAVRNCTISVALTSGDCRIFLPLHWQDGKTLLHFAVEDKRDGSADTINALLEAINHLKDDVKHDVLNARNPVSARLVLKWLFLLTDAFYNTHGSKSTYDLLNKLETYLLCQTQLAVIN